MKELSLEEINAVSGGLGDSLWLVSGCEEYLLSAQIKSCLIVAGFVIVATTFVVTYFLIAE